MDPQRRLLHVPSTSSAAGGIIVYPTDSSYAFRMAHRRQARARRDPVDSSDASATTTSRWCAAICRRSRRTRASRTGRIDSASLTPGPYTFILRATHELPKRLQDPKRRSIGIRVPDHPIAQGLLDDSRRAADELDVVAARRSGASRRPRGNSRRGSSSWSTRSSTAARAASSRPRSST